MSAKVYVGNLSWNTDDNSLRQRFEEAGSILDTIVMRDRDTGRSRGFGFVTFADDNTANRAIELFNENELDGRRIRVTLANARPSGGNQQGGQGGYGGGGGGGYGGGGGGGYGGGGGGGYGGGGGGYSSY
ncbi:hypothetical protein BGZ96_007709 [Linnemannia gamsii]|uniref:RRM domain-containing protein n=1 Tax=Linnemannia gamsii TaxID=64522 RepID=A0ABQ7K0K2_9FUNG|nr:hypothetical protein BGZ96_007709 [Linnemannia gamsii]